MDTDTLYSSTLLVALVAGGLGVIAATAAWYLKGNRPPVPSRLRTACLLLGLLCLAFGLLSAFVHMGYGHGPRSQEPMDISGFFRHHSSYWIVLVMSVISLAGWKPAQPETASDHDGQILI